MYQELKKLQTALQSVVPTYMGFEEIPYPREAPYFVVLLIGETEYLEPVPGEGGWYHPFKQEFTVRLLASPDAGKEAWTCCIFEIIPILCSFSKKLKDAVVKNDPDLNCFRVDMILQMEGSHFVGEEEETE